MTLNTLIHWNTVAYSNYNGTLCTQQDIDVYNLESREIMFPTLRLVSPLRNWLSPRSLVTSARMMHLSSSLQTNQEQKLLLRETTEELLKKPKFLMESYETMKEALIDVPDAQEVQQALNWYERCYDYNVPFGKQFRGRTVVLTFLSTTPDASPEDVLRAHAVGWAVELLQACFLIADDIEDESSMRRGQPTWHSMKDVGHMAVNDVQQLHVSAYRLIDKFCRGHPSHLNLLMLMTETGRQATMGQCMDLMTMPPGAPSRPQFDLMKMKRLHTICVYKTASYTFCHPVRHGLYLAGLNDKQLHEDIEALLRPLGVFFQIQDDFIDVFGNSKISGKVGTDIADGKSSWPIIRAFELCSPAQRAVLEENYGRKDDKCVAIVKGIFDDLGLEKDYDLFEEREYARLKGMIEDFGRKYPYVPTVICMSYLEDLYKRRR